MEHEAHRENSIELSHRAAFAYKSIMLKLNEVPL